MDVKAKGVEIVRPPPEVRTVPAPLKERVPVPANVPVENVKEGIALAFVLKLKVPPLIAIGEFPIKHSLRQLLMLHQLQSLSFHCNY